MNKIINYIQIPECSFFLDSDEDILPKQRRVTKTWFTVLKGTVRVCLENKGK